MVVSTHHYLFFVYINKDTIWFFNFYVPTWLFDSSKPTSHTGKRHLQECGKLYPTVASNTQATVILTEQEKVAQDVYSISGLELTSHNKTCSLTQVFDR